MGADCTLTLNSLIKNWEVLFKFLDFCPYEHKKKVQDQIRAIEII